MRSVEPSHQPPIYIIPQKKQIYFDNRKNLKKNLQKKEADRSQPLPPMRRMTCICNTHHSKPPMRWIIFICNIHYSKPPIRRITVNPASTSSADNSKPPIRRITKTLLDRLYLCYSKPPIRRITS